MPDLLLAKLIVIMTVMHCLILLLGVPKWLQKLGFNPIYHKPLDELSRATRYKLAASFVGYGLLGFAANLAIWLALPESEYGFLLQLLATMPTWFAPLMFFSRRIVKAN